MPLNRSFIIDMANNEGNTQQQPVLPANTLSPTAGISTAGAFPANAVSTTGPAALPTPIVPQQTAAVSVKLSEFWKNDPAMWFAQAEAQFALCRVTEDITKFYHIIAKVDSTVLSHVSDLVSNPPRVDKYEAIKQRLVSRFQMSEQARLEKLLNSCDLGDMKPTHLLVKMQELAAGLNVDGNLMKMLFLQRLPANVRTVLAIHDGTLTKLAEMADKLVESTGPHVAATSLQTTPSSPVSTNDKLSEQIALLTAEVRKLSAEGNRNRSSSRSRSKSSDRTKELCWYHFKYGDSAKQCRPPCSFQSTKN